MEGTTQVDKVCQHCRQPVDFRTSERGFREFVHEASGRTECPAATTDGFTPHQSDTYELGAILEHSWGYDQTNIDFFVIVKRSDTPKGDTWLTLQEMTVGSKTETGFMQGRCTPGEVRDDAKPIRRKLHKWQGEERGVGIERSYGWASLWDGKPANWTAYA